MNSMLDRVIRLRDPIALDTSVVPPLSKQSTYPVSLGDLPGLDQQHALIIKDVLYALLGYEGSYIRFSGKYNTSSITDRIAGPDHRVARRLDVSLKTITKKLLRLGKYYVGVKAFAEIYDNTIFGKVNQRLSYQMVEFLLEFRNDILLFESSFNDGILFTLNQLYTKLADLAGKLIHFYEIANSIHAVTEEKSPAFASWLQRGEVPHQRREFDLQALMKDVMGELSVNDSNDVSFDSEPLAVCKGGLVLEIVRARMLRFSGDRQSFLFLSSVYDAIATDYVRMLNEWLLDGQINDDFDEFFVKKNNLPSNIFYANKDKYWAELFVIRLDGMVEQLSNKDLYKKILTTGKLLNIIRRCAGDLSIEELSRLSGIRSVPHEITSLHNQDLALKVLRFHERANKLFLSVLFHGLHFKQVMENLHEMYFMNNSLRIDKFIDRTFSELSRHPNSESTRRLARAYDELFAIRNDIVDIKVTSAGKDSMAKARELLLARGGFLCSDEAFYNLAERINVVKPIVATEEFHQNTTMASVINRLVSERQTQNDEGDQVLDTPNIDSSLIAKVELETKMPFPLNIILSDHFLVEYQLLFRLRMILKFAQKKIENAWRETSRSRAWAYKGHSEDTRRFVFRIRRLISHMNSVLQEIQGYMNNLIIEESYLRLMKNLSQLVENLSRPSGTTDDTTSDPSAEYFLQKGTSKLNSVFDEKILSSRPLSGSQRCEDVSDLTEAVSEYLSVILRYSMITNLPLLGCMRALLNTIVSFHYNIENLKAHLIQTNLELAEIYSEELDGEIALKSVLDNTTFLDLINFYEAAFEQDLADLTAGLNAHSAENIQFGYLASRLSQIRPPGARNEMS